MQVNINALQPPGGELVSGVLPFYTLGLNWAMHTGQSKNINIIIYFVSPPVTP